MSRVYQATGINLKTIPLGEADRLLTILTKEYGLLRLVAPGSRKSLSKLAGRSEPFVVNQLVIAQGRSLHRITQAETIKNYRGLTKNLGTLVAGQYLAEIVLEQALTEQPQSDLFSLLNEHLERLEKLNDQQIDHYATHLLAHLIQGIYHLLAWGGIAPQVWICCISQQPIEPNFQQPEWRVGFNFAQGGTVKLTDSSQSDSSLRNFSHTARQRIHPPTSLIGAKELAILQLLPQAQLTEKLWAEWDQGAWLSVELLLRQYAEYHLGFTIRSASLLDTYLAKAKPNT